MRPAARLALVATTALAVTLPLVGPLTGAAAAPTPGPAPAHSGAASTGDAAEPPTTPSRAKVDGARAEAAAEKRRVAELETALAAATARLETASLEASVAAERYNGARWRLEEARKASRAAQLRAQQAETAVEQQRDGIVSLVTDSYQNGTELNAATAMLSTEGPRGLMNRYAVVESAGDSMEVTYDEFRGASARARTHVQQAATAQSRQRALAAESRGLAVAAGQAATAAGVAAQQIAQRKHQLVLAVAAAEDISVELATRRQTGLEQVARERTAAATRVEQIARQAVLERAATQARERAAQAAEAARAAREARSASARSHGDTSLGSGPTVPVYAPPPLANPAPNRAAAVRRTIAYAEAQVGKPYLWAAAGPASFDCSGLTMMAWAQGGKVLPHYSVAQFEQGTRVSMADARPGDLLFWSDDGAPSGIHHVALYTGGGQFIEAPFTGSRVRYNSVSSWYPDFVVRP